MSTSSIELSIDGQPGHNLLADRTLMPGGGNVRSDQRNWERFRGRSKWAVWVLFLRLVRCQPSFRWLSCPRTTSCCGRTASRMQASFSLQPQSQSTPSDAGCHGVTLAILKPKASRGSKSAKLRGKVARHMSSPCLIRQTNTSVVPDSTNLIGSITLPISGTGYASPGRAADLPRMPSESWPGLASRRYG